MNGVSVCSMAAMLPSLATCASIALPTSVPSESEVGLGFSAVSSALMRLSCLVTSAICVAVGPRNTAAVVCDKTIVGGADRGVHCIKHGPIDERDFARHLRRASNQCGRG